MVIGDHISPLDMSPFMLQWWEPLRHTRASSFWEYRTACIRMNKDAGINSGHCIDKGTFQIQTSKWWQRTLHECYNDHERERTHNSNADKEAKVEGVT